MHGVYTAQSEASDAKTKPDRVRLRCSMAECSEATYLHPIDEVGLLVQGHIAGPEAGRSYLAFSQSLQNLNLL